MKKNISFRHLKKSLVSAFAGLIFSTNVMAANDINALIKYLQDVLNASVQSVAEYIYEFNKLLPKTISTNLGEPKTHEIAQTYSKALAFCQVYNSLPRLPEAESPEIPEDLKSLSTDKQQYKDLDDLCQKITQQVVDKKDPAVLKRRLSGLPASDNEKGKKTSTFQMKEKSANNPSLGNGSFSFENLIAPSLYDTQAQQNALSFVAFSGKTYEPFPLDVGTWKQVLEEKPTEPEFINYQMALRSYVAAQSVAVSNLYRMIAERTEQPSIAQLKLKNDEGADIKSPLQYKEYLATHRANSQDWYNTMNSASANTVSREMLYILAEIQRSLYRMEQTNERLLATFSVMEMINLNSSVRPELKSLAPAVESLKTGKKEGVPAGT